MDSRESCKSWFCVLNNPEDVYSGEPHEIAEDVLQLWIQDKPTRVGAVAYCISAEGLRHLHMVLEDSNKARFSALKKSFPKAHLEPTRGTKEQAEDYINKRGRFSEKDEQVIYIARFGEIKGCQGSRKDFEVIETYIESGLTPKQILSLNFGYRRYEKMIRDAYYDKRNRETPFIRDVECIWHVGESGSGKSYEAQKIVDDLGEDKMYFVTDYENGWLDRYNGEEILFLDEYRGQIRYSTLLAMLHGYKSQQHARYADVIGLWNKVHITSVLPPDIVYRRMVSENGSLDTLQQLYRRIDSIWYHWKEDGEYRVFKLPMSYYTDYEDLKNRSLGNYEFKEVGEYEQGVFKECL